MSTKRSEDAQAFFNELKADGVLTEDHRRNEIYLIAMAFEYKRSLEELSKKYEFEQAVHKRVEEALGKGCVNRRNCE